MPRTTSSADRLNGGARPIPVPSLLIGPAARAPIVTSKAECIVRRMQDRVGRGTVEYPPRPFPTPREVLERVSSSGVGASGRWIARSSARSATAIAVVSAAIYLATAPRDPTALDYFVRLADAFLHGRVYLADHPSWLSELIPRDGVWYVPYPPMPAIVLMPFVAVFGAGFPQQVGSCLFAGASVGLAWIMLGRFSLSARDRLLLTAVFGFGTDLWYIAETGTAWYISHAVAILFAVAAAILALDRRWPWLAGLLLGCATLARLPVGLGAPFYLAMLLGLGWPPRIARDRVPATIMTTVWFGLGLAVPMAVYAGYNIARWGTPVDLGYTSIPGVLQEPIYSQGILSVAYIPRQLYAIFLRSWNFVDHPPWLQPSWYGLSLFLTTPLFAWLARARLPDGRTMWAVIGIGLTLIPIVTHGNVGFTQFGYRFALDFQPLLFVVLGVVFRNGMSRLAVTAAVASIAINAYAVWAIGSGFVAF